MRVRDGSRKAGGVEVWGSSPASVPGAHPTRTRRVSWRAKIRRRKNTLRHRVPTTPDDDPRKLPDRVDHEILNIKIRLPDPEGMTSREGLERDARRCSQLCHSSAGARVKRLPGLSPLAIGHTYPDSSVARYLQAADATLHGCSEDILPAGTDGFRYEREQVFIVATRQRRCRFRHLDLPLPFPLSVHKPTPGEHAVLACGNGEGTVRCGGP